MLGQMMSFPLTLQLVFDRAVSLFAGREIVTRTGLGTTHRYTYRELGQRVRQLATALEDLGVGRGDRVATFAWNSYRHLEAYFAVPCSGSVLHTVNIRLSPADVTYIINHAEDRVLLVDESLLPVLAPFRDQLKTVEHVVVLPQAGDRAAWPDGAIDYEDLVGAAPPMERFPELAEDEASSICYTSGTTGGPKGVLYSHRAMTLHAFGVCMTDSLAIAGRDCVLPLVPMFHVNAWGIPYGAAFVGAKQVFPGPAPAPADIVQLMESEKVTMAAGVPTIWLGVRSVLEQSAYRPSGTRLIVGGAAAPLSLIQAYDREFGIPIWHAWGMTEMSPIGTVSQLKSTLTDLPEDQQYGFRAKQGLPVAGVEIKAVDEDGQAVPWDGETYGELVVRGPWVTSGYFRDEAASTERFTADGWFRTGDVVTIDAEGYIQIMDRTKDLVKSGGEWISSQELENALMGHPKVLEAAVIARPDEKWQERPVACVVPRPGEAPTANELQDYLRQRFVSWWVPDDLVFLPEIPKTSVGKFDKKLLRERHAAGSLAPERASAHG
jgi:fatty-acyl-CoA synthase